MNFDNFRFILCWFNGRNLLNTKFKYIIKLNVFSKRKFISRKVCRCLARYFFYGFLYLSYLVFKNNHNYFQYRISLIDIFWSILPHSATPHRHSSFFFFSTIDDQNIFNYLKCKIISNTFSLIIFWNLRKKIFGRKGSTNRSSNSKRLTLYKNSCFFKYLLKIIQQFWVY